MLANSTRDVAAALDDHAAGQLRQMKRLVGGDGVLDAGDLVAVTRRAAGRDQDVGRAHALAVGHLHRMGSAIVALVLTILTPGLFESLP